VTPSVMAPAHLWVPPGARGTYGDEVAGIAEQLGRPLEGWQTIAVDAINSYGPGGRWHAMESGVVVGRQNGKSLGIGIPTVIADCVLWPDPDRVVWSTHRIDTYQEAFTLVKRLIDEHSWLSARVSQIVDNHQDSQVWWTNGSLLDFKVRSPGGGRGLGGRTVVIDEALFFPAGDAGALLPVLARRPNPRIIYLTSACKTTSALLGQLVARGRARNDPSLIWCEWCARGSLKEPHCASSRCRHRLDESGCALDDPANHRAGNPAIDAGTMRADVIRAFRRALSADWREFAREHLGWHEDAGDAAADTIPVDAWDARADETSTIEGQRVISLDVAPEGTSAAIGGAGRRPDGDVHLALVDHLAGIGWVVDRVLQLLQRPDVAAVVVDEGSPAAELVPDLVAAGLTVRTKVNPTGEIVKMTTRDAGAAAGMLRTRIAGDAPTAWHRGEQAAHDALRDAGRRKIGDGGWGFARATSEADITPIVAIAQALWGLVVGVLPEVSIFIGDEDDDEPADELAGQPGPLTAYQQFHEETSRREGLDDDEPEDGGVVWIG